ncbi:hypothetical protein QTP88_020645 [Uroleucon formosanum]
MSRPSPPATRSGSTASATSKKCTSNDDILKAIEHIQSSQDKLLAGHKSLGSDLKTSINALTSRFDSLSLEISELRTKVDLLESKVLALESKTSNLSTVSSTQISDVIQEFTERDRCKLNIIMYGLPESTSSDLPTKINDDKVSVRGIFSKLSTDLNSDFKSFRLGKPTSTSTRPLKVIFSSCEAASAVLTSYRQAKIQNLSLLPLTSIVRDKTLLERQQLRTCHLELDRRVAAGENNLTITFKNGSPCITNFFNYFNWKSTFLSYSPDDSMSVFLDALHYSILTFVPKISFRPSTFPSWYTKELKELVFAKSRAHAKFKSSQLLTDYKHFSLLRAKFKFISKQCYRNFVSRTESSLLHNPKYFWSFIRKNRSSQSIPSCVSLHGKQSTSLPDTANLFAAYFSSVFTQPSPTPSQTLHPICLFPLPSNSYFSISDVYKCLCSLRNVKSVGPDGIQGDFLYKLRSVLAEPLWLLFGRSIDSGIFPSALKLGSIRPILKSGDSIDVSNYRPITILPHLSKIFESLVLNSIRSPLNHILIDEQHGFRPGRSTLTCNLSLHSYIYDSFRNNCQVDVIYTDFSKAFDRVDHNHLMSTLDSLGIGEPLLSWFRSYITNRIQWVTVDSTSSDHFTPSSGVPQGAVLSPLLFALFVNSAVSVLHHAKLLIFADDMKIFFRIKSISDCHLLQNDLQRLVAWGESLGLALNIAKCSVMTFSRINAAIEHTYTVNNTALTTCNNYVKDLGFTLTRNLCPNMHIQIICCKALKLLGFINRVSSDFHLLSPLKTLFCSLVRPILEYGSVLWDPSTASARSMIERVQRKFLRQAAYKLKIVCPPHDYAPIHRLFSLESLADRRHSANVTFLSNLLSSKIDSPELLSQVSFNVPSRCTRSSVPFHIPFSSSNYYLNSPIIRLMRIANTDPSFSL